MRLSNLAVRFILIRKIRSTLTVAGIAIGVALIFAVAVTNQAIIGSFLDVVADLSGAADLQVNNVSAGPFNADVLNLVSKTDGIQRAAPIISKSTAAAVDGSVSFLRIVGVDVGKESGFRRYRLRAGRFLSTKDNEIVLVKTWADNRGLKKSDKVDLAGVGGATKFTIVGLLAKVGPGAADNGNVGFITLEAARRLYDLEGQVTQIDVKIKPGFEAAAVKKKLAEEIDEGLEIERPLEKGSSIEAVTKGVMDAFGSFGSLALFIGAFVVFNTMMMSVAERLREIGVLRLVGTTRRQVLGVILIESALYGLAGSALGLFLGQLLAQGLAGEVAAIYHIPLARVAAPTGWAVLSFAIGVSVSIVAGLQPAWRASRIMPIEIVRVEVLRAQGWLQRYGWLLGLIFFAVGGALFLSPLKKSYGALVFDAGAAAILFGVAFISILLVSVLTFLLAPLIKLVFKLEGRLAVDSIARGKSRTALAVITLLASLSMIIASGELRLADRAFLENWIAAILPFDISVRTPIPLSVQDINRFTPVDIGLRRKIEKVKGVKGVTPVKFLAAKGLNRTLFLISVEGKSWRKTSRLRFEEGDRNRALREMDKGGQVMISSTITSKNGVHAGERLKLRTPSGWRLFKVSGVFPEVANDGYVVYISRRDQIKYWEDKSVDGFDIVLNRGASLGATMKRLEKTVAGVSGVSVLSGSDIRNEIRRSVDQFLAIVDALVMVAIVVTGLGIINTLSMSVMERVREIGVLRAVGCSRWQIAKMVVAEATAVGFMGAILGTVVGLVMAWQLVVISHLVGGWEIPFVFPTPYLALAAVMSVIVTTLSSIYPARTAARIDIVKAVQWE